MLGHAAFLHTVVLSVFSAFCACFGLAKNLGFFPEKKRRWMDGEGLSRNRSATGSVLRISACLFFCVCVWDGISVAKMTEDVFLGGV